MAHSPGPAERRVNLIREMARSSERSHSRSSASSIGSAREQIHYDTATQELPLPSEHEFQINSSALRRAFPDFSQYGSSEEDSIELGRGLRGSLKKQTRARSIPSADVSENLSFSLGGESRYEVTGTPPLKPRDKRMLFTNVKSTTRASSMKENVDPLGRAINVASIGNRAADRKVLVESMQPRVESDDSESLDGKRSAPANAAAKNTRFDRRSRHTSNARSDATGTVNINDIAKGSAKLEDAIHNGKVTGTHQSFLLPDLPNITELVSGVRQDGTPLFSRSAKATSRFGTPSQRRKLSTLKQSHLPIDSVPIPVDEKSLYVSLQLLQDKVVTLEAEKTKAEDKLEEYEMELLQMKSKLEEQARSRHSDSALGTDIEEGKRRDWQGQKTQLESSIRNLQDRLDRANKKLNTSEVAIASLTNDRDAAHRQLAVAYLNSEELKHESDSMQKEIADVKAEFANITRQHEARIAQLTNQEAELRAKIGRREQAVKEMGSLAKELWETRNALAAAKPVIDDTQTHTGNLKDNNTQPTGLFANTVPNGRMVSAATTSQATTRQQSQSRGRQVPQRAETAPELEATTDLRYLAPPPARNEDLTVDSTYASFMDGDEVSKLRKIVEEDKALLAQNNGGNVHGETQHTFRDDMTRRSVNPQGLPRKSSMKTVSQKFADSIEENINSGLVRQGQHVREDAYEHEAPKSITRRSMSPERHDTQRSMFSQRSQRRTRIDGTTQPDMTSAFILPDITLKDAAAAIMPSGSTQATSGTRLTTVVTRPTPVSDRLPITLPDQEDPTVRPSQSPGLALATVLRGLENELNNLRAQLTEQEKLYNQHDPSLSKRQRKVIYARIQRLLPMIDTRADQIYALYDVLEGQKDKGQLMQEEEVEITLQNMGIDPAAVRAVSGQTTIGRSTTIAEDSEADIDEDEDELPWEGIETTQTQTLPSLRGMRVR